MAMPRPLKQENQQEHVWKGIDSLPYVKALLKLGVPVSKIAKQFGVSRQTIYTAIQKLESPRSPTEAEGATNPEGPSTTAMVDAMVPGPSTTPQEEESR